MILCPVDGKAEKLSFKAVMMKLEQRTQAICPENKITTDIKVKTFPDQKSRLGLISIYSTAVKAMEEIKKKGKGQALCQKVRVLSIAHNRTAENNLNKSVLDLKGTHDSKIDERFLREWLEGKLR